MKSPARLPNIRYRKPHGARHTSVSWDLMIGRNPLWVARQHGHSIREKELVRRVRPNEESRFEIESTSIVNVPVPTPHLPN